MQEKDITFKAASLGSTLTVDDVKETFGVPREPEIRTSLMSTNTYTIDKGHNKGKKAVKGIKIANEALDANMHKTLTKSGIPRRLNGNKLGLRKRLVAVKEQVKELMNQC